MWRDLGVKESEHGPALPCTIRVRRHDGSIGETPILLVVPSDTQRFRAIKRAREVALDNELDPNRNPDGQHHKIIEYLENREELAFAVREESGTQMFLNGSELEKTIPNQRQVEALYAKLDEWKLMCDPRFSDLTGEDLWNVISEIARTGTIDPLARIDGLAQIECITLSAREALKSPSAPSSRRSSSTSGSASAPPTPATGSTPAT